MARQRQIVQVRTGGASSETWTSEQKFAPRAEEGMLVLAHYSEPMGRGFREVQVAVSVDDLPDLASAIARAMVRQHGVAESDAHRLLRQAVGA